MSKNNVFNGVAVGDVLEVIVCHGASFVYGDCPGDLDEYVAPPTMSPDRAGERVVGYVSELDISSVKLSFGWDKQANLPARRGGVQVYADAVYVCNVLKHVPEIASRGCIQ